jgi:hypothetical protein
MSEHLQRNIAESHPEFRVGHRDWVGAEPKKLWHHETCPRATQPIAIPYVSRFCVHTGELRDARVRQGDRRCARRGRDDGAGDPAPGQPRDGGQAADGDCRAVGAGKKESHSWLGGASRPDRWRREHIPDKKNLQPLYTPERLLAKRRNLSCTRCHLLPDFAQLVWQESCTQPPMIPYRANSVLADLKPATN